MEYALCRVPTSARSQLSSHINIYTNYSMTCQSCSSLFIQWQHGFYTQKREGEEKKRRLERKYIYKYIQIHLYI